MIKKLGALVLAFSIVVGSLLLNAPKEVVLAEPNRFGGYYETLDKSGELNAGEAVGTASSAVITGVNKVGGALSETVSVTVDGNIVTIGELSGTVESSMVLGNYYTLTVNNKAIDFRFVTKAIKDKNDVAVLNLTSKTEAIKGYYVLANNIVLEKGEENSHDVNGTASGKGLDWLVQGFRGTFDGQGYNIDFYANSAGFFGVIGEKARIINTGFVNVKVYKSAENPVLFNVSSIGITEDTRAWMENVYIRMGDKEIPIGGISASGSIPLGLKNVVLEFPGASIDHGTSTTSVGALWGADNGWWDMNSGQTAHVPNTRPCTHQDVYGIGRMPLTHYKYIAPANTQKKKGFYYTSEGKLAREWMEGYAENEGVEEDIFNGNKVYKGIKKYNTTALLADDKDNDYSTFDKNFWGVEQYGVPVWLNGLESQYDIFVNTLGEKTSAAFYLELGGVETATIGFGLGGISVEGVPVTFEFIKGEEFISIDTETGVVTAINEGMAQIKVKCTYNGKNFEKKYTVYVDVAEGYEPPSSEGSGCGTFFVTSGTVGGGALMILSAFAFTMLRKKKALA